MKSISPNTYVSKYFSVFLVRNTAMRLLFPPRTPNQVDVSHLWSKNYAPTLVGKLTKFGVQTDKTCWQLLRYCIQCYTKQRCMIFLSHQNLIQLTSDVAKARLCLSVNGRVYIPRQVFSLS